MRSALFVGGAAAVTLEVAEQTSPVQQLRAEFAAVEAQIQQAGKVRPGVFNTVIKLRDMTGEEAVKREMALVCVKALPADREQIEQIISDFQGRLLDKGEQHLIFEVTGDEMTVDVMLEQLAPFGIKKLARSGVLALYREP